MKAVHPDDAGRGRPAGWGVPVLLALLLTLSTAGLIAAELLGASLVIKIALSATLLAFAIALVVSLVAGEREERPAPESTESEKVEPEPGPPALPWMTPVVRAVLDQVDAAVHITDAAMTIRYLNPAFSRLTGYAREDALGRNAITLLRSGAHEDSFYEALHEALQKGEVWSGRIRNRRMSGEHFEAEETISPIRGKQGVVESYVSIQRDLSESDELERRMAQAKAIESFGLLAGGLAHDLNNFLIAVRTNVNYVKACVEEGGDLDADARDALRETLEALDRAGGLASKLLTMGKVHDRIVTPIDPSLVIEGLEATLQHAVGPGVVLSSSLTPGAPRILMDAVALEQIVVNLVLNARDALGEGGTIIVEGDALWHDVPETGERLCYRLRVRDNGPGIPEEIRDRIFEPFFTTKEGQGGTGLGLPVVRELIENARGSIELAFPEDGGTEITILLPGLDLEDEGTLLQASMAHGPGPSKG